MISSISYTREWIENIRRDTYDCNLIEKMVMAYTLVECLKLSGLDFIFKGGTALGLILGKINRFSIDIDIILPAKYDLSVFFRNVINSGRFLRSEENLREGNLPKSHFKFFYNSIFHSRENYILLDILYETNIYSQLQELEIRSPILAIENQCTKVLCPIPECILGDKLTAFAPHTTGIPYGKDKQLEIAKQLFDVATLFDVVGDFKLIGLTHEKIATKELKYRNLKNYTVHDVLLDSFNTACLIGDHGYSGINPEFQEILNGISKLKNYVVSENFTYDSAILCAAKTAFLSATILNNTNSISRYENSDKISTWKINNPQFSKLNKLKKTNVEAYYYFHRSLEMQHLL